MDVGASAKDYASICASLEKVTIQRDDPQTEMEECGTYAAVINLTKALAAAKKEKNDLHDKCRGLDAQFNALKGAHGLREESNVAYTPLNEQYGQLHRDFESFKEKHKDCPVDGKVDLEDENISQQAARIQELEN